MSLNESIVKDAALTWSHLRHGFRGQVGDQSLPRLRLTWLGYAVGYGRQLAHSEPAGEQHGLGDVVLAGRLRKAIRRLPPAVLIRAFAARVDTLLPKLLSGKLSVAEFRIGEIAR